MSRLTKLAPMLLTFVAGFLAHWFIDIEGRSVLTRPSGSALSFAVQDVSPVSAYSDRFYSIAAASGTDKVQAPGAPEESSHHYEFMYQKYLGHIPKSAPLRILEIGLGCVMWRPDLHPPGASFKTWRTMFPNASLSYVELDEECALKHRAEIESTGGQLFTGSQTNETVMAAVRQMASTGGGFDMIVDDGGHMPLDQMVSLEGLWAAVRPGGVYVIEDLLTSYFGTGDQAWGYGGKDKGREAEAIMPWIKDAVDRVNCRMVEPAKRLPKWKDYCEGNRLADEFASMDCAPEICVFTKRFSVERP